MIKPTAAQPFNAAPTKSLNDVRTLAEASPEDALALTQNLQKLYDQGRAAYGWSDQYGQDARTVLNDGQLKSEEVYQGRPAFQVYETSDVRLGPNTKASYVPGRIQQRDGVMFLKMDGGRELVLGASERMPRNSAGDVRKDLIGGFVSQDGESPRVRLKGTVGQDGRFKVEFAAPDRPEYETFEQGRLYWNSQSNWLELQTPRGNVVITNPQLLEELGPLARLGQHASMAVILPGEAKPGPQGGLVYDQYPPEYGALTGFSRFPPNSGGGPSDDTRITNANFGFGVLTGVPITYPAEQEGRVLRNDQRPTTGLFGENTTNGRFWAFGKFTRSAEGRLGFQAREVTEQTDRWGLSGGQVPDADSADAVKLLAEAHSYGSASGPTLSGRNDGW